MNGYSYILILLIYVAVLLLVAYVVGVLFKSRITALTIWLGGLTFIVSRGFAQTETSLVMAIAVAASYYSFRKRFPFRVKQREADSAL
jgi:hypothetical protein